MDQAPPNDETAPRDERAAPSAPVDLAPPGHQVRPLEGEAPQALRGWATLKPTPPSQPAPSARTLYLGHSKHSIDISDNSLLIRQPPPKPTPQRIPLARIARIVSSSHTDWSGAALHACQNASIPISWIDPQGDCLGTLFPHRRASHAASTAVQLLLETAVGLDHYHNWQRARRLAVLWQWRSTAQPAPQPQVWEQTKNAWIYRAQHALHLPRSMRGHCLALVAQQLAKEGVEPLYFGPQSEPIALDHDLCELLWAEMNLCTGPLGHAAHDHASTTLLFERWQQCHAAALFLHLNSLKRLAQRQLAAIS